MTRSGVFAWLLASTAVAAIPAILFLDAGAAEYGEAAFSFHGISGAAQLSLRASVGTGPSPGSDVKRSFGLSRPRYGSTGVTR